MSPLFYILAPFGMAFALFAVYLVVSIMLGDPVRPFRMFAAGSSTDPLKEAHRIMGILEEGRVGGRQQRLLVNRMERLLSMGDQNVEFNEMRARFSQWLADNY